MIWPNDTEPCTSSLSPGAFASLAITDRLAELEREIDQHRAALLGERTRERDGGKRRAHVAAGADHGDAAAGILAGV